MRPHTHDGPIGCCAVKPSLSSFTYSRGSRWRCGSPGGVGGARYPGHSAASCPLLSGKLRDLANLPAKQSHLQPPPPLLCTTGDSCIGKQAKLHSSIAHVTLCLRISEKVVFRSALHTSHGYWGLIPSPPPPLSSRIIFILWTWQTTDN